MSAQYFAPRGYPHKTLAAIGKEQFFESERGRQTTGPKNLEYRLIPSYDISILQIIKKGNVVGSIALYHSLHPSSAAVMHVFIFAAKRTINIVIIIQRTEFNFISSCFFNNNANKIIKSHNTAMYNI